MNSWPRTLIAIAVLVLGSALWLLASRLPLRALIAPISSEILLQDAKYIELAQHPDWQSLGQRNLLDVRGPYWLRYRFDVHAAQPLALRLSLRGAWELYNQGDLVVRNGVVAASSEYEVPGQIDRVIGISKPQGETQIELLLRVSSHARRAGFYAADVRLHLAPPEALADMQYQRWLIAAMACGAVLVGALYFTMMLKAHARKDTSSRYLLALCVLSLLLPLLESWRWLFGYSYDWHGLRLALLQLCHASAAVFLVWYLGAHFQTFKLVQVRAGTLVAMALVAFLPIGFDMRSWLLHLIGLLAAILCLLLAQSSDRKSLLGMCVLFTAMLLLAVFFAADYLDGLYLIAYAVLLVSLLLQHSDELLKLGQKSVQLESERARLHAELLRRSMQPHFLLNTLTAMQELIEQNPNRANAMIDKLAAEFQNLREMSALTKVLLERELELCRNHLELREFAHDLTFKLTLEGAMQGIELPPGVLHAMVENAFTHAGARACAEAGFYVRAERVDQYFRLKMRVAMALKAQAGEGTGSEFVRASLRALYGEDWGYEQKPDGSFWLNEVLIPCAS